MMNKINSYLLTNYPRIWNLRIVPFLILLVVVHIVFVLLGYALTDSSIDYKDNAFDGFYYVVFAGSILTSILVFIFWIIQYNKNNGVKAYYPYSNKALYVEWLCILLMCIMIIFIPLSLTKGRGWKWKNAMPIEEVLAGRTTINKAKVLLPTNEYDFQYKSYIYDDDDESVNALLVGDAEVDRTKFDTKLFTYEEDAETPDKPIRYVGPSLLYYNSHWDSEDEGEMVKKWLKQENKAEIEAVMQDYIDLHKKHGLKNNLKVDKWMKDVYHPPLYPVANGMHFFTSHADNMSVGSKGNYTETNKLSRYYNELDDYNKHSGGMDYEVHLLLMTMALGLSVMVFSARFASGKSWIFALLATGVTAFVFFIVVGLISLISASLHTFMLLPMMILSLFVFIVYSIVMKVVNGYRKGRSNIYMHMGVWLIPSLVFLVMQIYFYLRSMVVDEYSSYDVLFWGFMLANIIFTLVAMYPAIMLLRKWKALPED